jgi:acyl-CoA dehydrogenase
MTADPLLVSTADDVLAAVCTHAALQDAERDGWAPDAWAAVADMGLPWIGVPEEAGGQGGTLADALAVLRLAGRHGLPLPLAETGLLGGWLLASASLQVPDTALTVVPGRPEDTLRYADGRVTGSAHRVPWARAVERVVALLPDAGGAVVAVISTAGLRIDAHRNLAGEPRDTVHLDGVTPESVAALPPAVDADALALRGALTRVVLMAGAVERVRDITVQYTGEREQFGRPVARFQAVQQHLVHIAQQAALLGMAADLAGREAERGNAVFEVSAARSIADEAARLATRASHQAHGAMGMTQEYALHHLTRRLWSWRNEYGDGAYWSQRVGSLVAAQGADGLYPLITAGSAALAG